jgi:ferric-dicitrate binding protein FerR (iron transport regulator)
LEEKQTNKETTPKIYDIRGSGRLWIIRIAAAAVVIFGLFTTIFLLSRPHHPQIAQHPGSKLPFNDIAPGGNKAILTLADGKNIVLDTASNGTLAQQGGIKVIKTGAQLNYSSGINPAEVLYNTVTTPKGGQYQLTLSDGSRVWLNAASSLHFPTAFSGKERKVELTGEGYFEVAKNKEKPFIVTANNTSIEVLGTHFNVNAYSDENSIKTTLLEGSVKVSKGNAGTLIVPGEQARVNNFSGDITVKKDVDLDETVAWKNGKFVFQSEDIKSIMRQLERWYDVNVVYSKNVTDEEFIGSISRQVNISEILEMLEKAGSVYFEIKGRTIIVK